MGYTRGIYVTANITLVTEECCACGVTFAMPDDLNSRFRENRKCFYCPNGHSQHYTGTTTEQKLKDAAARETHLRDQLQAAAKEAELVRLALIRDRQRVANGVCPCCNRFFTALHSHMSTQHPDYDVTKVEQSKPRGFRCTCGGNFGTLRGLRIHQGQMRPDDWWSAGKSKNSYYNGAHLTVV